MKKNREIQGFAAKVKSIEDMLARKEQRRFEPMPKENEFLYQAECLVYEGKIKKAIKKIKRAIDLKPNMSAFYHKLSLAYGMLNNYDRATQVLEMAIQIDPDWPPFKDLLERFLRNLKGKNNYGFVFRKEFYR